MDANLFVAAWIKQIGEVKKRFEAADSQNPEVPRDHQSETNIHAGIRAAVEEFDSKRTKEWSERWIKALIDSYECGERLNKLGRLEEMEEVRLMENGTEYPNQLKSQQFSDLIMYARISIAKSLTSHDSRPEAVALRDFDKQRKYLYLTAIRMKVKEMKMKKMDAENVVNRELKVKIKDVIGVENMMLFEIKCNAFAARKIANKSMPYFFSVRPDQENMNVN